MGHSFWLTRGALPLLAALAAAPVLSAPANARVNAPASSTSPGSHAAAVPSLTSAAPSLTSEWWLNALSAQQAWASAPQKGAGVTLAVLSTGTEGTAVASLIAGHGPGAGGSRGITGIAPKTRVLPVRVTSGGKTPPPDAIAQAIGSAVSQGATVIDLPLNPASGGTGNTGVRNGNSGNTGNGNSGSTGSTGNSNAGNSNGGAGTGNSDRTGNAAGGSAAEQAAVRNAIAHNVVLVAPAGDTGRSGSTNYPAAYPGVVAVGATDSAGKLAPYSDTGSYVALTAPGDNITADAPGNGSATLSSTDASSALTAGIAALVRSRYPRLSAAQVTQALKNGAMPASGPSSGTGAGEVNAPAVLTAASSVLSLNGAPLPPPAPAWQQYAKNGQAQDGPGLLSAQTLTEAGLAAGALILAVLILTVAIARRRRRRRPADPLVWGYPADGRGPTDGRGPAGQAEPAARRVSAADALSRNTGVRVPPRHAAPDPRELPGPDWRELPGRDLRELPGPGQRKPPGPDWREPPSLPRRYRTARETPADHPRSRWR